MNEYPEWLLKYKEKGTAVVKKSNNCYYLYKVHSEWNPKKHRAQKITDKYIGKVTPNGIILPKYEEVMKKIETGNITVKEYGATHFLMETNKDLIELLKRYFPADWREIFVFAMFRFIRNSPIKNLKFLNATSFVSDVIDANMYDKHISSLLKEIGTNRELIKKFMSNFIAGSGYLAVGLTHVFSLSENIISSMKGYNSKRDYTPQVNLLYLFSLTKNMPVYFRILVGSIASVSSLSVSIKESGAKDVVLIGDKGFYSESNVKDLEAEGIHYILPLKRDNSLINYDIIKSRDMRKFGEHFIFERRPIHCYFYDTDERRIFVFLDDKLRAEEMKDGIQRLDEDKEKFYETNHRMGTIAVITDLKVRNGKEINGAEIYSFLKQRVNIEQLYDTFTNILEADRTYLRDDYELEGWMFINFIAILLYYRLYNLLVDKNILKDYSIKDCLLYLERIQKIRIGDKWITSEIPKKTRLLLNKIGAHIT